MIGAEIAVKAPAEPLVVRGASRTTAEVYAFTFDPTGWAVFTLCEATGDFAISSDWGSWSYRWNPGHIGAPNLKHFLARGDAHYVASKFMQGGAAPDLKDVFDAKKTKRAVRMALGEWYRDHLRTNHAKDRVQEALAELDDLDEAPTIDLWCERCGSTLSELLGGEPWHYVETSTPFTYEFLVGRLFPFFVAYLRTLPETEWPPPKLPREAAT